MSPDQFGDGVETLERKIGGEKARTNWDWANFESTRGFPVDDNMINWTIGQDQALKECFLCLDEWVHKLKWLEKKKWYEGWGNVNGDKPSAKTVISPGPMIKTSEVKYGRFASTDRLLGGRCRDNGDVSM